MRTNLFIFCVLFFLLFLGCTETQKDADTINLISISNNDFNLLEAASCSDTASEFGRAVVSINEKDFDVEIANTCSLRSAGLKGKTHLDENSGMLFVFPYSKQLSFWMREVLFPLDVVFIDENFFIVDIQAMEPCEKDPCFVYTSNVPARYALEVNRGVAEKQGFKAGDRVLVNK